jgi:hypothetical protein
VRNGGRTAARLGGAALTFDTTTIHPPGSGADRASTNKAPATYRYIHACTVKQYRRNTMCFLDLARA